MTAFTIQERFLSDLIAFIRFFCVPNAFFGLNGFRRSVTVTPCSCENAGAGEARFISKGFVVGLKSFRSTLDDTGFVTLRRHRWLRPEAALGVRFCIYRLTDCLDTGFLSIVD